MRCVIDTNVFVSHLLLPQSIPAQIVRHAARHHTILMSADVFRELSDTLARPKFNAYLSGKDRRLFLRKLYKIVEPVEILQRVRVARDVKDDMILELAVNGKAALIISGDKDLLTLKAIRRIPIISPGDYAKQHL